MSQEDTQGDSQTLGTFLRDHRKKMNVSLEDVSESTKISLPILRAIEEDDYDRMPADAFCRGFYSMYASFLHLPPEEIITRYLASRGYTSEKQSRPPIRKSKEFSTYAEPSAISPGVGLGVLLLTGLIVIIAICWYLDWNPSTYISKQFTNSAVIAESVPSQIETPAISDSELITNESAPVTAPPPVTPMIQEPAKMFLTKQEMLRPDNDQETATQVSPLEGVPVAAPYILEVDFNSDGTLNLTLDDGLLIEEHFTAGESLQWQAKQKILLDLPEEISATLRLNGVEYALPQAENGRKRILFSEGPLQDAEE